VLVLCRRGMERRYQERSQYMVVVDFEEEQ
jgi:hypothetical protein